MEIIINNDKSEDYPTLHQGSDPESRVSTHVTHRREGTVKLTIEERDEFHDDYYKRDDHKAGWMEFMLSEAMGEMKIAQFGNALLMDDQDMAITTYIPFEDMVWFEFVFEATDREEI